ncbi:MAG: c-type cytochrome [Nitrospinaceae bacterium]
MTVVLISGPGVSGEPPVYTIWGPATPSSAGSSRTFSLAELEALGTEEVGSPYFDRAMNYRGSRFRVISFSRLVDRFDPAGTGNAVLLNCFDDYQGILTVADIRRYRLRLATRIKLRPGYKKPGWLNPLLVIVPEGSRAPFQERFMTANIRELRFVDLEEYYAPLRKIGTSSPQVREGMEAFKNNCLFCHSLNGVGGNKGIRLPGTYDFSRSAAWERFQKDFAAFHHKDHPNKQNVDQFVSDEELRAIVQFLGRLAETRSSPPHD